MRLRYLFATAALPLFAACGAPQPPLLAEGLLPVSGGDSLAFRLEGRGRDTIVVLHGGPALNSRYLELALRPLAGSHVLLFYDQRGRGRSSGPHHPDSLSFTRDLEDLAEVQAHFRLGPLRLVGHHWGAALAAQYAIRHPDRVSRMVLVSPMPEAVQFTYRLAYLHTDTAAVAAWTSARASHADSLDPSGFCRQYWGFQFSPAAITAEPVVQSLASAICDEPVERLRTREATWRQLFLSLPGWNWADSLRLAPAPALVVVGGESATWLSNAAHWSARLSQARLLVLGRTALFPWAQAGPALNRAVDTFFGGAWPTAAIRVDSLGKVIATS